MRQRKPLLLILALLAALALIAAGCGDDDDSDDGTSAEDTSAEESTDTTAAESGDDDAAAEAEEETSDDEVVVDADGPIQIAVVAPSAQNDLAFTQSMVDALTVIGESRDIELDITDGTVIVEDAASAIRGYADDGFDLVIAHGSQYGAPLSEIAPDFPDIAFAWGTSADTFGLDNVFAYTVQSDQGGYVLGTMAASLTESGVLGVVGPVEVGDAKLYVDGFEAGALATDPGLEVNINYIESFNDVALAAEAAEAHLTAGADVMTGTAQMVVGATGVAREADVAWFGTQSNQTSLGESNVVASQVYHWEVVLEQILDSIASGTLGGETYTLTFANDGLVIEYNDGYELPADVRTLADETVEAISSGSLETGVAG
ncbi:MAG: BMP family protein [Acidimicrobiia bacterium]|nr:BMP family protein [Acidimicrobiia bacterium]